MLKLKVISPERILFIGDVERVLVPGMLGSFEILQHHAPIISTLEKGKVTFSIADGDTTELMITGGFAEVQKDEVRLCVET